MSDRIIIGAAGESMARSILMAAGYVIVSTNYRCAYGEIDIVAFRSGVLAFVEVKTRLCDGFGSGAEAVNREKQRRIRNCASFFLQDDELLRRGILLPEYESIEFQVVDIEVSHIEGLAF